MQKLATLLIWSFLFLLPTQFGKHFFMEFSYINGVRVDYLAPAIYVTDILFVLLGVLYWKHVWREIVAHRWTIGVVATLALLNVVFAVHPFLSGYGALKLAQMYLVFILFKTIHVPRRIVLSSLLAGTVLQFFLALGQLKVHQSIGGVFYYLGERALSIATPGVAKAALFSEQLLRPYGTFSHPNSLGGFYVLLFAWVLEIKAQSMTWKICKVVILVLSAMLALLSFSKVAIVSLIVVMGTHFVQTRKKSTYCWLCIVARLSVVGVVAALFLSAQGDVFSGEKRISLMNQAGEIFMREPLFGTHFGHHLYAHALYPTPYPYFFLQPVHNVFILFFMQAGSLLGGFAAWHIGTWLTKLWHLHRKKMVLPLIVIIATGFMDHYWITLQQNMLLLGVVFGSIAHRKPRAIGR